MTSLLLAPAFLLAGAVLCLATRRRPSWTRVIGPGVSLGGGLLGILPSAAALAGSAQAVRLPWSYPFGSFHLEMDALSAVFAMPILIVCALAAVYGAEYLKPFEGRKNLALSWFLFNLLAASMLLVVVARNAMLFLLAWETMSLSSFFLVLFESEREQARRAGWTYLVATHIGTAFLLVLFVLLGRQAQTLDFDDFSLAGSGPGVAGVAFLLAVIGFGTKAGFMPLHVWLPEAHPAAPSHVSAVMSGVMIKTGIYGLVRVLTVLGPPPPWWGGVLIAIGVVSGVAGVLLALAQHDLKRLLAYSSVENIGIIALGLGVGLLGLSHGLPLVAFAGFAGALLHVINHALFKSLLFLGAGSVLHACGTREIEGLGGLLKRMPHTGLCFLAGAAAICGLPPLNGFISEFLVYLGSFRLLAGSLALPPGALGGGLAAIAALALIGGLAAACFTKAFGLLFLGEPRGARASGAHEAGPLMRVPMAVLAALCLLVGLGAALVPGVLAPAVGILTRGAVAAGSAPAIAGAAGSLAAVATVAAGILGVFLLLAWLRSRLLAGRPVESAVTWDCGYAAPTARMQYTASSYSEPLVRLFRAFLHTRHRFAPPQGLFPAASSFSSETPDVYRERMYRPAFAALERFMGRFRWLQHGRLNLYVLYIVLALLTLLAWKLR